MKYKNFRTIARIIGVLAWVVGILTFILFLVTGITAGGTGALLFIVIGIVTGFISFVFVYAFSQFIYVLLDIERNTRETLAALLEEVEPEEGE